MLARLRRTLKITVFAIFSLSINKVSTALDIPFGAAVRSATAIVNQTLREHHDDQVFVVRPNTDSVIFLIDGTGSMINKFATLKDEYTRTINGLRPEQSFDIVIFEGGQRLEIFSQSLSKATPEAKKQAARFPDGLTGGGTVDIFKVIDKAMSFHPALLYFVTDAADFAEPPSEVIPRIKKLNQDRKTHINTILFAEDKAEREKNYADSEPIMKQIADENGGTFKLVEMDVLQSKNRMFRVTGNPESVVFVADGSGSMVSKMARMKRELSQAIDSLDAGQSFNVVVAADTDDKPPLRVLSPSFVKATDDTRRQAKDFVDPIHCGGANVGLFAVDSALDMHPNEICYVTDGAIIDAQFLDSVRKHNTDRKTRIDTVLLVDDEAERNRMADSATEMKQLAEQNGGSFRLFQIDSMKE